MPVRIYPSQIPYWIYTFVPHRKCTGEIHVVNMLFNIAWSVIKRLTCTRASINAYVNISGNILVIYARYKSVYVKCSVGSITQRDCSTLSRCKWKGQIIEKQCEEQTNRWHQCTHICQPMAILNIFTEAALSYFFLNFALDVKYFRVFLQNVMKSFAQTIWGSHSNCCQTIKDVRSKRSQTLWIKRRSSKLPLQTALSHS